MSKKKIEVAIKWFEDIATKCQYVKDTSDVNEDAKTLATLVRKDCFTAIRELKDE